MEPKDVMRIPTMEEFNRIKDSLNLSDRQRKVFHLKYSKLWRIIDIAEELGIHPETVANDLKDIRMKLAAVSRERTTE